MVSETSRVALVTGGASGIGLAAVSRWAAAGVQVVVADVDAAAGQRVVDELAGGGQDVTFVHCDVASEESVRDLLTSIERTCGRLDMAFNNAGVEQRRATVTDCTEDNWDRTIDTNLKGIWLSMKHEIALMRRAGGGAIVNTTSIVGSRGVYGAPAYVASKHGIIGLTRCAALEEAPNNIRVNAVAPGHILTPMVERVIDKEPQKRDAYLANTPLGRLGTSADVAQVVTWLCSEDAAFVTGSVVDVDGGILAR